MTAETYEMWPSDRPRALVNPSLPKSTASGTVKVRQRGDRGRRVSPPPVIAGGVVAARRTAAANAVAAAVHERRCPLFDQHPLRPRMVGFAAARCDSASTTSISTCGRRASSALGVSSVANGNKDREANPGATVPTAGPRAWMRYRVDDERNGQLSRRCGRTRSTMRDEASIPVLALERRCR